MTALPDMRPSPLVCPTLAERVVRLECQVTALLDRVHFLEQGRTILDARICDAQHAAAEQQRILWQRIELQDRALARLEVEVAALRLWKEGA